MASFLNANLPSEDEEDDDYRPELDNTGEPEDRAVKKASGATKRRRRGLTVAAAVVTEDGSVEDAHDEDEDNPIARAKKAKVDALWQKLNGSSGEAAGAAPTLATSSISLAALCKPAAKPNKNGGGDNLWMKSLGLLPQQRQPTNPSPLASVSQPSKPNADVKASEQDSGDPAATSTHPPPGTSGIAKQSSSAFTEEARARAAAAIAAAKEAAASGASKSYGKVAVTETRKFAGKDIEVTLQVEKDSKEAQKAAQKQKAASSGLDAFLKDMEKKKKVNVLDKSKMDWEGFKETDTTVLEELEAHKKSSNQYLDKQQFLQTAALKEYEKERDQRLGSDIRTRGRL